MISVSAESHRFAGLKAPEDFSKDSLVSNVTNQKQFSSIYAYNDSKLCCLMFALSAHRQFGFKALAVHPGNMVCSYLSRNSWFCRFLFSAIRPFAKSLQQAAASGIFAAIGKFDFSNCFFTVTHIWFFFLQLQKWIKLVVSTSIIVFPANPRKRHWTRKLDEDFGNHRLLSFTKEVIR